MMQIVKFYFFSIVKGRCRGMMDNNPMANSRKNQTTINILPPERLILAHLYKNPGKEIDSAKLISVMNQEAENLQIDEITSEDFDKLLSTAQENVESLIVNGLVKGKRVLQAGKVIHTELELTTKGEIAAIKYLRSPSKIVLDI
jgi:hypothetical protein